MDKSLLERSIYYIIITVAVLLTIFPIFYIVSLSFQSVKEMWSYPPPLLPSKLRWSNYIQAWNAAPFSRFTLNSFVVAGSITMIHVFLDSLGGYVFAKFRFPGQNLIFLLIYSTLVFPIFIRMIPLYIICNSFGWNNTYQGLIFPFMTSAFGIFLMRQIILPIPRELIESARIDGCSELGIFWRIIMPLCKPGLAIIVVYTFIFQWNSFLWPLIMVDTTPMKTLPLGITAFSRDHWMQWNLVAASAIFLFIPTLILFITMQKWIMRGALLSGLKS